MKSITKAAIIALILVKVSLGSFLIYRMEPDGFLFDNSAIASEAMQSPGVVSVEGDIEAVSDAQGIDMEFLLKERAELQAREEILQTRQEELELIQKEVQEKLNQLSELRNEINARKAKEKPSDDRGLKQLIKIYTTMKPQKAASLIEKLDTGFAIELLSQMKGDAVGNILSFVELEKGATISEGLASKE